MKFSCLIIIGIITALILSAGCAAPKKSVKSENLPACEFPRQIGVFTTGVVDEFPIVYAKGVHSYGDSTFVLAPYSLVSVKILIFDKEWKALDYFENSNYYSSQDCRIINQKADCLVESGKSTNDRFCTVSDVSGRCVNLVTADESWKFEFEWLDGSEIKSVEMTGNAPTESSKKLKFIEPFVNQFKDCVVELE